VVQPAFVPFVIKALFKIQLHLAQDVFSKEGRIFLAQIRTDKILKQLEVSMKQLKCYLCLGWMMIAIVLTSCSIQSAILEKVPADAKYQPLLATVEIDRAKIVMGETVYVPVYSHIYHFNSKDDVINLSATLSIRNTDLTNSIIITAVRYYDTNGKLIKQYIKTPSELRSMASTDFLVESDDTSGGIGANFLVEWVSEQAVFEPVIEAVMISTVSTQGISFLSPGRVVKRYNEDK
jgi:hypothetical protein